VDGKIFNSRGVHVAIVLGPAIFDLAGKKLYNLKGVNIYKLSGELVGHLLDAQSRIFGQIDRQAIPGSLGGLVSCDYYQALTGGFRAVPSAPLNPNLHGALASDDALNGLGEEPRFRVRESRRATVSLVVSYPYRLWLFVLSVGETRVATRRSIRRNPTDKTARFDGRRRFRPDLLRRSDSDAPLECGLELPSPATSDVALAQAMRLNFNSIRIGCPT